MRISDWMSDVCSSDLACATSYSTNDLQLLPFYIYYSMFGFQRVGDDAWQAGDMRARGFLLGATAGRTTLNGEGLQHEDGHRMVQAGLNTKLRSENGRAWWRERVVRVV